MKYLIITQAKTGVDYYRLTKPNHYLVENYEDFDMEYCPTLDSKEDFGYKIRQGGYDAVVFNRTISHTGNTQHVVKQIHQGGAKVIVDVDDYWVLPKKHLLYEQYKQSKIIPQQIEALKSADAVTCTTPYLADKVKEFNKNVHIIPNAIDPNEAQWQYRPMTNEQVNIGWIAGVHHIKDIASVHHEFKKLAASDLDYKLFYGGWHDSEFNNQIAEYMGAGWNDKFSTIKAMPVSMYGLMYDMMDITLAPLQTNSFNQSKSELKAIEAGFKKTAFVCSDIYPYKYICNKTNSMPVKKDWFKAIEKLIKEPDLREDLSERLYEDVSAKYHMAEVSKKRYQVYKHLTP